MSKYILFIALMAGIGCKNGIYKKDEDKNMNDTKESYLINVTESPATKYLFTDLINHLTIIRLEDSEKGYLHSVDRIYNYKDRYYILDRKAKRVLMFNDDGNYLGDIGRHGMGPGETPDVADVSIDTLNKNIILLSKGKKEIQFFYLNGEYIRSIKNDFQSFYLAILNEEKKWLISYINYYDVNNYNVKVTTYDGAPVDQMFPFPENIFPMYFAFTGNLVKNYQGVLYSEATSPCIYQITRDGKYFKKYSMDFGRDTWPESERYNFKSFLGKAGHLKIKFLTSYYAENKNTLVFTYTDKNVEKKVVFLKKTKKVLSAGTFHKDDVFYKIFSSPVGTTAEGLFISYVNIKYMPDYKDRLKAYWTKYHKDRDLIGELSSLTSESNEVLILYDFKN